MSVKVQVFDRDGKALTNADVFVKWKSGSTSRGSTSSNGLIDLRCSGGEIDFMTVWGKSVAHPPRVGNDDTIQVTSHTR